MTSDRAIKSAMADTVTEIKAVNTDLFKRAPYSDALERLGSGTVALSEVRAEAGANPIERRRIETVAQGEPLCFYEAANGSIHILQLAARKLIEGGVGRTSPDMSDKKLKRRLEDAQEGADFLDGKMDQAEVSNELAGQIVTAVYYPRSDVFGIAKQLGISHAGGAGFGAEIPFYAVAILLNMRSRFRKGE
jgi:hypothetical protein